MKKILDEQLLRDTEVIISRYARAKHTAFVVGHGPIPTQPVQMGFHWVQPISEPPKGHEKWVVFLTDDWDFRYQGLLLIHDPVVIPVEEERDILKSHSSIPNEVATEAIGIGIGLVLGVLVAALVNVILSDPLLVIVLDDKDQTWLCLDSWYA